MSRRTSARLYSAYSNEANSPEPNKRRQQLAVDLGEQRVAAGPRERGVELAVDGPELVEVRSDPAAASSAISARSSSLALVVASSAIAGSMTLRTSNSWDTRILRSSASNRTAGSRSTTTDRLPRRSR